MSFFTLPLPFGSSSLSQCLLSPTCFSFFFRTSLTRSRWHERFAPQRSCPRHDGRLLREPLRRCGRRVRHAHCLQFHASCGLGALPKRRGNEGSDFELPHDQNTLLEVRWTCVSRPLFLSLCDVFAYCPSTRTHARAFPCLFSSLLPPFRLRLRLLFLVVFCCSSLYLNLPLLHLRFLLLCFSSSSSSPLPPLVLR